ncbi:flavin monoamine oxidase family protein [Actinoallomurus acaciae]|uniref:Flavin monoamine oxidase family protein n=1 Tax=Actinoallomurus acaciae TaxID=502577 RepID=A0ABV5YCN7_9ACTN
MSEPTADVDVVIVGGGPAGIAAARRLRDHRILLLEETDRLGGRLRSEPRGRYWINLGGHLFPGEGSHIQEIIGDLGLRTIEIPGIKFALSFAGRLRRNRRVETYPLTLRWTPRERLGLVRVGLTMLRAVRGWHEAMKPRSGETEAQRRARVAGYLADRTFRDLIGTPPERVDAIFRAAARRAASEIDEQSAGVGVSLFGAVWSGKKSSMALNLDGGSGRLGEAAAADLGAVVSFGSRVVRVAPDGDGVLVDYVKDEEKTTIRARQVVMAVPAPVAHRVVEGLPDDVHRVLGEVTYGPFLTMGVLTGETGPMPYDDIYAVTTPDESFDMLFNHANPLRRGARRPGGSLMVYSGGAPAAELMRKTDQEVAETYLADLYRLFPTLRGAVEETVVQRWELGNVYRRPGLDFTPMLRYCGRTDTSIHFCGDWFAELGNMEVAAGSAVEAAERVDRHLRAAARA